MNLERKKEKERQTGYNNITIIYFYHKQQVLKNINRYFVFGYPCVTFCIVGI